MPPCAKPPSAARPRTRSQAPRGSARREDGPARARVSSDGRAAVRSRTKDERPRLDQHGPAPLSAPYHAFASGRRQRREGLGRRRIRSAGGAIPSGGRRGVGLGTGTRSAGPLVEARASGRARTSRAGSKGLVARGRRRSRPGVCHRCEGSGASRRWRSSSRARRRVSRRTPPAGRAGVECRTARGSLGAGTRRCRRHAMPHRGLPVAASASITSSIGSSVGARSRSRHRPGARGLGRLATRWRQSDAVFREAAADASARQRRAEEKEPVGSGESRRARRWSRPAGPTPRNRRGREGLFSDAPADGGPGARTAAGPIASLGMARSRSAVLVARRRPGSAAIPRLSPSPGLPRSTSRPGRDRPFLVPDREREPIRPRTAAGAIDAFRTGVPDRGRWSHLADPRSSPPARRLAEGAEASAPTGSGRGRGRRRDGPARGYPRRKCPGGDPTRSLARRVGAPGSGTAPLAAAPSFREGRENRARGRVEAAAQVVYSGALARGRVEEALDPTERSVLLAIDDEADPGTARRRDRGTGTRGLEALADRAEREAPIGGETGPGREPSILVASSSRRGPGAASAASGPAARTAASRRGAEPATKLPDGAIRTAFSPPAAPAGRCRRTGGSIAPPARGIARADHAHRVARASRAIVVAEPGDRSSRPARGAANTRSSRLGPAIEPAGPARARAPALQRTPPARADPRHLDDPVPNASIVPLRHDPRHVPRQRSDDAPRRTPPIRPSLRRPPGRSEPRATIRVAREPARRATLDRARPVAVSVCEPGRNELGGLVCHGVSRRTRGPAAAVRVVPGRRCRAAGMRAEAAAGRSGSAARTVHSRATGTRRPAR